MNNWVPKSKTVKIAAIVALFSVILYFTGLFITLGRIREIENFYYNTESESSREEKVWVIESITGANKEIIETLRSFFVQKNDEIKFIEKIEEIAKISAVKFEIYSINIIESEQPNSLKEDVSIKIKIEGSWKNLLSFVNRLEKMPFGILIQNFDLNVDTPGNWSGLVELVVFREK